MDKITKGKRGEAWAEEYLIKNGYTLLSRNYRKFEGEIDLIAWDPTLNETVFVEVKARWNPTFGNPEEAVGKEKILKIVEAAEAWLAEEKKEGTPWRIDVIALELTSPPPRIEHFKNITQDL